ncbi:DEAD/DEAH box helicase [Egicoccus sp. AB-alg2]|uniref:DEAD/DEAH box helicase n=1 Tax=Egicoccus sp. AB-alg2 TaxID=3242693 RepID=UPI00359EDA4F
MTITFSELGVPAGLVDRLASLGVTSPFPIQRLTLEDALAGRDLCGRAPTGSGKTLAFSLPVAIRVGRGRAGRPRALLLVPTRELAAQVAEVLTPLLQVTDRRVVTLYGGTNINRDRQRLRSAVDVVVATPGRLEDLLQQRALSLADVDLVVLDEADRMADMGFLPVVRRLLDQTRDQRQTLLFSATLDGDVDVLVRRYQQRPARHEFDAPAEERGDVRHVFWPAERPERRQLTAQIVRRTGPAIVFTRTKHGADRLAKQLAREGVTTAAIHGNRSQKQRESALARFADGSVRVLVATDVAARGIHVDDVAAVVHYDQPATDKDYVHRSGRTGRAGADGLVVSLVGAEEHADLHQLQRTLRLPEGLHELDLGLLDAEVLPAPMATVRDGRRRASTGGRPNGNGGNTRGRARSGRSGRADEHGGGNGSRSSGNGSGGGSGRGRNGNGNGGSGGDTGAPGNSRQRAGDRNRAGVPSAPSTRRRARR